ncbi:putative lipid-transfer protein DIR1 [Cucumis melo var. makuwa]|uniref:Bifunctional inhibitor/plant lipid transfer protein/seed storage helical domain-containing protein n=2 Tax=Cucumis melo TaxID=3656 RepID=A0A9I9DFJ5_CUCME|nr:putative lipid-transfer protein DIR1 [Cucumis melo var. makuwa]
MDKAMKVVVLALVLMVVNNIGFGEAQSICNMPIAGLYACRPAVTPPNPTAPTAQCCMALGQADLHCFCAYRNSGALSSFGIDPNLAMQLPKRCNISKSPNC